MRTENGNLSADKIKDLINQKISYLWSTKSKNGLTRETDLEMFSHAQVAQDSIFRSLDLIIF